ncbi:hypothetical protein DRO97_05795 [Archaeoglobales archaeon]|nr:MAG: hypothetical protein DRO97_05795 [Archaeoglobales archaeon]
MREIYDFIQSTLYFGDETLEIGSSCYNPLTLFGILISILNGKELVFGEYGSGKTTSSERISSLMKGLPLEFVQAATIHSHPEQTEEKIKATLDLGVLEREGRELIRWKILPFSPVIIIDEINRLPVGKQSLILNEVDRNVWSYRGETLILDDNKSFFATINYQDIGTTKLIPPLLDRFDLAVETARLHPIRKRLVRRGVKDYVLRDSKLTEEMVAYIAENSISENAKQIIKYIDEISEEFKETLEERINELGFKIEIPRNYEIKVIKKEIEKIEFSDEAELFLDYLTQEVYCQLSLKKEFSRCDGCHYANYICSDIYLISNRAEKSLFLFSKALAWFLGDEEANLEHLICLLPFVLWHRCAISDAKLDEVREIEKDSSDEFYAVKDCIRNVKRRWEEHKDFQIEAYMALKNGDYGKIEDLAEKIKHPFFKSFIL